MSHINTFSIVAYDPDEQAWGVGVASKFLAVGAVVNWAQAGAGAVATQALANLRFGPDGLAMMAQGNSAQKTLENLLAQDDMPSERQVALIDAQGGVAVHTGSACMDWAGHRTGKNFACQGNLLAGEGVVNAMAEAFLRAGGELADRIVAALSAGERVGGDRRGKQSAALCVVRPGGGYGGNNDRYLDLRVDDDPNPVTKLKNLVEMHHLFFGTPQPEDQLTIDTELATELQTILQAEGYLGGDANGVWDEMCQQAFWSFVANENLEERWHINDDVNTIDRVTLDYLRRRFNP